MDTSLSKLRKVVKEREAWRAAVYGSARVRRNLASIFFFCIYRGCLMHELPALHGNSEMLIDVSALSKGLSTVITFVGLFSNVNSLILGQVGSMAKDLACS